MLPAPSFETERLLVNGWHEFEWGDSLDLAGFLCVLLSDGVTSPLPSDWRGEYTRTRAEARIEKCDQEGSPALVVRKLDREPIGLLFSYQGAEEATRLDLRLGYVLAESAWGSGFATELVSGFVEWCRSRSVTTLTGGVERNNTGSARVLVKNGFVRSGESEDSVVEFFTLTLGQ